MTAPTPFLDCFRRGEAARDVKILAARGELAPRRHEQLALLIMLLEDADPEIRQTADATLNSIPVTHIAAFLALPDVPIDTREFFADRGIFPDETPTIEWNRESDEPLLDAEDPEPGAAASDEEAARLSPAQTVAQMGFTQRLKAAMKGSRELRAILIRDTNRMVAAAVLSSPKLSESEVEAFARMPNVGEEVLRTIASNRAWVKNYPVVVALTRNSKTPLALSLNLMARLNDRDLAALSVDRNVPEALRVAARKKVVAASSRR